MIRGRLIRVSSGLVAAALIALASQLPLWSMTMRAPQYPKGLRLYAYGTEMTGDLRELSILNHYIGMPPVEAPSLETALFPIGIAVLVALCLLAPVHRWLFRIAAIATAIVPVTILADLQWRLYEFGHSLDPTAPIRLKPFTPLVIGETTMGNFRSTAMISWGFVSLLAAGAILLLGARLSRRLERRSALAPRARSAAVAAVIAGTFALPAPTPALTSSLQARLDLAPRGSTVTVDGGVHSGPIVVRGPLTVVGVDNPVIDGGGVGSVVTIAGDDVLFRGFAVRNSGRQVTEEAAGITVTGNRHRIEDNDIRNVYFGIHIGGGSHSIVRNNQIVPGEHHGARPGHGISVWNLHDSQLLNNRISEARDGVYLSFTERTLVAGNAVTKCRYGLHSMYSQSARFENNDVSGNLLGAALMMSDRVVVRGNRIRQHRQGVAAYGILLKDIGDLVAEGNHVIGNRVGVYAESVPTQPSRHAMFAGNLIAGNEVGLALQSNAALTVTGNRIAENLTDVRALGRQLSPGMRWSHNGRGNSWGQYRGYDADRDGIGDLPYRLEDAMDALVQRNPLVQTFLYSPAHLAFEAAARMFPLYRQAPILIDARPLMTLPEGLGR